MDVNTDHRLVRLAQSGERGAFSTLVTKYRRRILKITLRYTRNDEDAEDAVQETFIKAYRALNHFRGDAAFSSWLYRIAVNSAKTVLALRARNSRVMFSQDEEGPTTMLNELETPEDLAITEEICVEVNAAIEGLPDEQRTAIVMCEFQGLSYSQVAAAMSCPIGTVRSRVSRARDAIDQRLHRVFDHGLGRAQPRTPVRPRGTRESRPLAESLAELV